MKKTVTGGTRWMVTGRRMRRFATCHLPLLLTCHLFLAACGFQPLHGRAYQAQQAMNLSSVEIVVSGSGGASSLTSLPHRYAELLKAEIEDQANPQADAGEKLYRIDISFTEQNEGLFVNPDGTASRGDLRFVSNYTITRIADAKVVTSGGITRISSYNSSPTADYASYVSIEDARKRGVIELAKDYKLRLASLIPALNNPSVFEELEKAAKTPATNSIPSLQPVRAYESNRSGF